MNSSTECPRVRASFFSKLIFWWMTPIFIKGRNSRLEVKDLYDVMEEDKSSELCRQLSHYWNMELASSQPSLTRALRRVFGFSYVKLGILVGIEELLIQIAQPILLGILIRRFDSDSDPKEYLNFLLIGGVILCSILYPLMHHTYFFQTQRLGMQMRTATTSLMYRKALKSPLTTNQTEDGGSSDVMNLMSNDVSRFDSVLGHLHFLWVAPIQLGVVIYILWGYYGVFALSGIGILIVFGPLQVMQGKLFGRLRHKTAQKSDRRVAVLTEMISIIRAVKIYVWENLFISKVAETRSSELRWIQGTAMLRAVNATLHHISTKLAVFVILLTFVLAGNTLTSEAVFVTMALFNNVRQVFTYFVPLAVSQVAETKISVKRISAFLLNAEKHCDSIHLGQIPALVPGSPYCVMFTGVNLHYGEKVVLKNIQFSLQQGTRLTFTGATGSGKSSIISLILGDLRSQQGTITVSSNHISYAPQDPWIFEGTVKENILFGSKFEPSWYAEVLRACALEKDLDCLANRDDTRLGANGSGLSGGQKARVSLARAIYANADLTLLDDPLKAVDGSVAKHIFSACINGIMRGKSVLLVQSQTGLLPQNEEIIVLDGGYITYFGSLQNFASNLNNNTFDDVNDNIRKPTELQKFEPFAEVGGELKKISPEKMNIQETLMAKDKFKEKHGNTLTLYSNYFKFSYFGLALVAIFSTSTQLLYSGSDIWLQKWVKSEDGRAPETLDDNSEFVFFGHERQSQFLTYAILFSCLILISLTRATMFFRYCWSASKYLHSKLLSAIVHSKMAFFHTHPPGSILNVFTKDMGAVDDILPVTLYEALEAALNVVGVLVVVSLVEPILIAPSVVVVVALLAIRNLYLLTARNIKRMEGLVKGSVYAHVASSKIGLPTIRAFRKENLHNHQFDQHQDQHTSAWFLMLSCTRWLAFVVEFVSIFFISCVSLCFVFLVSDGASVGLAISSAMTLTGMFQWGVRQSAETENQLISVERIINHTTIPQEEIKRAAETTNDWPEKGQITFDHVTLNYNDDPIPTLVDLCFSINGGEKIGVVGRTGAGKSSLISSFLRLIEPSSGQVYIDSVNIHKLDVHSLRSKISVIPQDPVLFEGSLRQNIDPHENKSDLEIWDVARKLNLTSFFTNQMKNGLDSRLSLNGGNVSSGQKQLLCLMRAFLENNKILILDEATSSLDSESASVVEDALKTYFSHCTIISVAHRLESVIDFDKILVLDAGRIVEFDSPSKLLQNSAGHFFQMVQQVEEPKRSELFVRANLSLKC